jgi:cyclase
MIKNAALKSHVPLTVGGGIKNVDQMKELMHNGADKIALNYAALTNRDLISKAAHVFGDQCVVVSIDAVNDNGKYKVFDYINKKTLDLSVDKIAAEFQSLGAGEILINSVDRDGSYTGYDVELINSVCNVVTVPVICCGGAKNAKDFIKVFEETNVSAASAANFFHFSEHSVNITKSIIKKELDIRLETFADYKDSSYDVNMRLDKKSDEVLENMLFIRIKKEII